MPDLLSKEIIEELKNLQNRVSPLRKEDVKGIVESYLGMPLEEAFSSLREEGCAGSDRTTVGFKLMYNQVPHHLVPQFLGFLETHEVTVLRHSASPRRPAPPRRRPPLSP